jgi:hypothetical protein
MRRERPKLITSGQRGEYVLGCSAERGILIVCAAPIS